MVHFKSVLAYFSLFSLQKLYNLKNPPKVSIRSPFFGEKAYAGEEAKRDRFS
jgi:hypothetical protein